MRRYVVRRLLYAIPTLLGISVIVFLVAHLAPGDPIRLYTFGATDLSQEDIEGLRRAFGLDKPLHEQYLDWLTRIVRGDFGKSLLYHRDSLQLIVERIPNTLTLVVAALLLAIGIGIPLGIVAALNRGSWIDNVVRVLAVVGHAVPAFWLGLIFIIVFAVNLRVMPSQGVLTVGKDQWDIVDRLRHLVMPAFVFALTGIANYSRYLRTETLEVIQQDYIRTAHAKGLRERTVIVGHALRNAMIPMVTALGGILAVLISSSVVIEQIFTWPGLGQFTYNALRSKDYPVVMAAVMVASSLLVLSYLIRDVVYSWVDPRIKAS